MASGASPKTPVTVALGSIEVACMSGSSSQHQFLGWPSCLRLVARAIEDASGRSVGVVLVGIDGMEWITTAHGPDVADLAATAVEGRMRSGLRGDDTLARVEEDTFAVVMATRQGRDGVATLAQRMAGAAADPIAIRGRVVNFGGRIGWDCSDPTVRPDRAPSLMDGTAQAKLEAHKLLGGASSSMVPLRIPFSETDSAPPSLHLLPTDLAADFGGDRVSALIALDNLLLDLLEEREDIVSAEDGPSVSGAPRRGPGVRRAEVKAIRQAAVRILSHPSEWNRTR